MPHILLVEDDIDTADLVRETLVDHFGGDSVLHVDCVFEAEQQDLVQFDLVLSDLNLPDGSGLDLIDKLLRRRRDLPIVVVTSEASLEVATMAIRRGAYDYVVKSGDYLPTIPLVIEKNLAVWRIKVDNLRLQHELQEALDELRIRNRQLKSAVAQLERQALTDPLTGLANRRQIQATLDRGFDESMRYGTDLACVMIDIDGFKPFNDSLGHQEGDRLLQAMARVLSANCRRSDVAGRYGGDEFFLLLPHTSPDVALQVTRRIQEQFAAAAQRFATSDIAISLSIGIACVSLCRPAGAERLLALADAALYRAKQSGKSRIVVQGRDGVAPETNGRQPALAPES